eukprot:CAMPEP_0197190786 /NCGR_PEP_ID=MMETSP1423-20130617/22261_1 /TAXON_ID=476441 /ORGANISM="Pseudo-nitzschia heimii, Strain UNC1101" /LENGTH=249 /DNA_ID=CAMNT_0042643243 /DNA_START=119 /DNA_END=868 /DNA_ORIENTATION=-
MIATHACRNQFGRFAIKNLVMGNIRRGTSLFNESLMTSSLSQSSSTFSSAQETRSLSSHSAHKHQPLGDLYKYAKERSGKSGIVIGDDFVGKTASINRVFGPGANAQALLTSGGEELARQASFDPNYKTAKGWIRSRPVGPAVLSSTLISGLVGALTEASFPQSVPVNSSMSFLHPLIVGVEVAASIRVESIRQTKRDNGEKNSAADADGQNGSTNNGYEIMLSTRVTRAQDDVVIAEGAHTVWIPGYL